MARWLWQCADGSGYDVVAALGTEHARQVATAFRDAHVPRHSPSAGTEPAGDAGGAGGGGGRGTPRAKPKRHPLWVPDSAWDRASAAAAAPSPDAMQFCYAATERPLKRYQRLFQNERFLVLRAAGVNDPRQLPVHGGRGQA